MRLKKNIIVFIIGPTAIGKTRLSIKLAKKIQGEIISCDSMQAYRGMRILSQAPSTIETKKIRHHLICYLDPNKEYSAAIFKEKAAKLIDSIFKRKHIPIMVGGSGLYVKAIIDGLFPSPEADLRFRKKMERYISRYGSKAAHKKLSKIDPDSAKKIHPNDSRRIIRALEIHHSTGKTMSELKSNTKGLKDRYDIKIFGLTRPRDQIYSNIDLRVERMFEDGVLNEVKRLRREKLSKTARAVLGFKEISGYLNGEYDLQTAKKLLKRNTRRFAKRQLTWFRPDRRIRWFDTGRLTDEIIIKKILRSVK